MENSISLKRVVFFSVCYDKIDLQRKKYNFFFETITCVPSIYIMDFPDFIVWIAMENSICLKRVNVFILIEPVKQILLA